MKLTTKAFNEDYWRTDADYYCAERFIRRAIKRRLGKARRKDGKAMIKEQREAENPK